MCKLPRLNFPSYKFRVRKMPDGGVQIWDDIRSLWLVLTPEEWVRRHVIAFLVHERRFPSSLIKQECPVLVNGMNQRADVVVFNNQGNPVVLCECKAPHVNIDPSVYAQAVRYNTIIGAEYIMLTNGLKHLVYKLVSGTYQATDFPL